MHSALDDYSTFVDRERTPEKPYYHMRFKARDLRILQDIHSYGGVLKDTHIRDLEFPDTRAKAHKRRLTKLFHHGYVDRSTETGTSHSGGMVYWLTEKGAAQIAPGVDGGVPLSQVVLSPPWAQMQHDLGTVDLLLTVQRACEQSRGVLELREWVVERQLRAEVRAVLYITLSGRKTTRKIIPDLYTRIQRHKPHHQPFVSHLHWEKDQSTHPTTRFVENKILPGLAWLKSETYQRRFGANRGRWCVVTETRRRLGFLREVTHRAAGKEAFLWNFAVASELTAETILTQPIWYPGELHREPVALFPPPHTR